MLSDDGDPRALHSFPTRRSSDLGQGRGDRVDRCFAHALGPQGTEDVRCPCEIDLAAWDVRTDNGRSEEHTSELQSRLHLVCRLLLEKKKPTLPVARSALVRAPRL